MKDAAIFLIVVFAIVGILWVYYAVAERVGDWLRIRRARRTWKD